MFYMQFVVCRDPYKYFFAAEPTLHCRLVLEAKSNPGIGTFAYEVVQMTRILSGANSRFSPMRQL